MPTPRRVKELTDIEVDEISLVDIPANQYAKVQIAKRASEEDTVPKIFNENGEQLDPQSLQLGDVIYDEDGEAFEMVPADELDNEYETLVQEETQPVGKSFSDEIRESLSKAFTEEARDDVISKAMARVEAAEQRALSAEIVAKSERDLRLLGQYTEVAKNYNIPGSPEELAPVLMRMSEALSYEDCSVIHKALQSAGQKIYDEIGSIGGGDNADIMSQVSAFLESDSVSKAAGESVSKAAQVEGFFAANPDAYDAYRAELQNR